MKLVNEKGVNDLGRGAISFVDDDGKRKIHRFYSVWSNMILRCYCEKLRSKYPTYSKVTVCDEWLRLSAFKDWFDINYVTGWHLDKDLLIINSKVYSPSSCRFIPRSLNNLFSDRGNDRGKCSQGVYQRKKSGKFKASLNVGDGRLIFLGDFNTNEGAHQVYLKAKVNFVLSELEQYEKDGVCKMLISEVRKDPLSRIIKEPK